MRGSAPGGSTSEGLPPTSGRLSPSPTPTPAWFKRCLIPRPPPVKTFPGNFPGAGSPLPDGGGTHPPHPEPRWSHGRRGGGAGGCRSGRVSGSPTAIGGGRLLPAVPNYKVPPPPPAHAPQRRARPRQRARLGAPRAALAGAASSPRPRLPPPGLLRRLLGLAINNCDSDAEASASAASSSSTPGSPEGIVCVWVREGVSELLCPRPGPRESRGSSAGAGARRPGGCSGRPGGKPFPGGAGIPSLQLRGASFLSPWCGFCRQGGIKCLGTNTFTRRDLLGASSSGAAPVPNAGLLPCSCQAPA